MEYGIVDRKDFLTPISYSAIISYYYEILFLIYPIIIFLLLLHIIIILFTDDDCMQDCQFIAPNRIESPRHATLMVAYY